MWLKCQSLKKPLEQLNAKWYMRTTKKVDALRKGLQDTQHNLQRSYDISLIQEEKKLMVELEKLSNIEENNLSVEIKG